MAENVYEGMFILDSNRYSRDQAGVSGQLVETIQKCGGSVLASRLWEERRLAYPIAGHRKGTYWLIYFKLDSSEITKLNRDYQLNENVIRTLVLKVDPRIVDALVSHALSSPAEAQRSRRPEPVGAGVGGEGRRRREAAVVVADDEVDGDIEVEVADE